MAADAETLLHRTVGHDLTLVSVGGIS